MFIYAVKYFYLFCVFMTYVTGRTFDWGAANTSVWLSSGAYCPTEVYLNRTYLGYSKGFVPTDLISDDESDTRGYIGYMPDQRVIYIVMRGSVSITNWVDDFDAIQTKYASRGPEECSECYVHAGFNYAWSRVADSVIANVNTLRAKFPDYKIVSTGHSLGGALASLCAATLKELFDSSKEKVDLHLYTFGAPRFSNFALSQYLSTILEEKNRITHYRDMAPHCPPFLNYEHIEGEWYESEYGEVKECNGMEDPDCADQWFYTTVEDHMNYLSLPLGCTSVSRGQYKSVLYQ